MLVVLRRSAAGHCVHTSELPRTSGKNITLAKAAVDQPKRALTWPTMPETRFRTVANRPVPPGSTDVCENAYQAVRLEWLLPCPPHAGSAYIMIACTRIAATGTGVAGIPQYGCANEELCAGRCCSWQMGRQYKVLHLTNALAPDHQRRCGRPSVSPQFPPRRRRQAALQTQNYPISHAASNNRVCLAVCTCVIFHIQSSAYRVPPLCDREMPR